MSPTKTKAIVKRDYVDELLKSLNQRFQDWLTTAELYVEAIDAEPEVKERLLKVSPEYGFNLSPWFLNRLEQVGRHQVHWRLLPGWGEGRSTQIRRLPFSEQKEIFEHNKKYPLLLPSGDHLMVDVRQISKEQAQQIFGDSYIRDVAEQKIHMAENPEIKEPAKEIKDPYRITSKGLEVAGYVFTKTKLREILMQM